MGAVVGKINMEGADSNGRQYAALSSSSDDSTERYYALIMMLELAESCLVCDALFALTHAAISGKRGRTEARRRECERASRPLHGNYQISCPFCDKLL